MDLGVLFKDINSPIPLNEKISRLWFYKYEEDEETISIAIKHYERDRSNQIKPSFVPNVFKIDIISLILLVFLYSIISIVFLLLALNKGIRYAILRFIGLLDK